MLFQAKSRCNLVLVVTSRAPELVIVPLAIAVSVNVQLDGVVTSRDRCHVPLQLLQLASLVQVAQRDSEPVRDNTAYKASGRHLEVLIMQLVFCLHACELGKEECILVEALSGWRLQIPKLVLGDLDAEVPVSWGVGEARLERDRGVAETVVVLVTHAGAAGVARVDSIVGDFSNDTELTRECHLTNLLWNRLASIRRKSHGAKSSCSISQLSGLDVAISCALSIKHKDGDQHKGVEGKRPDHIVQHACVGDDTKA